MLRELTVREVLKFSAELRLPSYTSSMEIDKIVEDVISLLGLSDIRYSEIGSVDKRGRGLVVPRVDMSNCDACRYQRWSEKASQHRHGISRRSNHLAFRRAYFGPRFEQVSFKLNHD